MADDDAQALKVATSLRELARVPRHRNTMAKDQGSLPGLVFFLEHRTPEVVEIALEALQLLSMETKNHPIMYSELGLVISLKAVMAREEASPVAKKIAKEIMLTLSPTRTTDAYRKPLGTTTNKSRGTPVQVVKKHAGFFRSGSATKMQSRMTVLEVQGLHSAYARRQVEDALLTVKGSISFTFDLQRERVNIRARKDVGPERFCKAIYEKDEQLIPRQVVKNQYGEDSLVDYLGLSTDASAAPDYLDDEDDDDFTVENPKEAIVTEAMAAGAGGWFGNIAGFVKSNLYW